MKKVSCVVLFSICIIFSFFLSEYIINKNFILVKTISVNKQSITQYLDATGTVNEQNKRELYLDFPLKVKKIYISIGEEVKKGQKLIEFDKSSLLTKLEYSTLSEKKVSEDNLSMKAAIENAPTELLSPINGIITNINCYENMDIDYLKAVVTISDMDNLIIKAKVPESNISDIYVGQDASISGQSFKGTINAKVVKIYPTAERNDKTGGLIFIDVDLKPDSFSDLKPGVNVEIKFVRENKEDVIIIPFDAVMFDEDTPYVFINRYGYAVKRTVLLGDEFKTNVEILKGLSSEDELVLSPKSKNIKNGSKLSTVE